ncbi:metalloendoproteinase 1-like [Andrographis paniculata]|uniref:metalloendoproteinase 1-like n=1 Tax=Andrographis paniculata TaxID=175694 RepID=UPI0021E81DAA|nr:metalloendoproteinase 1-like [Andrographis paniculata]
MDFLRPLTGVRPGTSAAGISKLKQYLNAIGHMSGKSQFADNDNFDKELEQAVKSYQKFFSLPVTGFLDPKTLAQLQKPRCGVPDNPTAAGSRIPAVSYFSFFPGQPRWSPTKKILWYSFPAGTRQDAYTAISAATQEWSHEISFRVREHGDGASFDGPGGIVAHAFAPPDGRLHFDGDEQWADAAQAGKMDLETVGLHELGHVLGLGHSTDKDAVMWPYIDAGVRKHLNKDDIDGIKRWTVESNKAAAAHSSFSPATAAVAAESPPSLSSSSSTAPAAGGSPPLPSSYSSFSSGSNGTGGS